MYFVSPIFNAMLCMLGLQKLETGGGMPKDRVRTYCCCMVTLKPLNDVGSQYTTKYTIYTVVIKFMNRSYVFMGLSFCFICCLYVKKKINICSYLTLMFKIQCMYLHSRSLGLRIYLNPH